MTVSLSLMLALLYVWDTPANVVNKDCSHTKGSNRWREKKIPILNVHWQDTDLGLRGLSEGFFESVNGHFWSNLCLKCTFKWT